MNIVKMLLLGTACLCLGVLVTAMLPLLVVIGWGLLVIFIGYLLFTVLNSIPEIDAEVEKLKKNRRGK